MGADNIDFKINGQVSVSEIKKKFDDQRVEDKDRNGHRDGYSGDFQTVDKVDTSHLDTVFETYDTAYDFCLDKAVKWSTVIAVYYKNKQGEIDTLVAGWGAC